MEVENINNNQGMQGFVSLFTVEEGKSKVLLIKKGDTWSLAGGEVLASETTEQAIKREVFAQTGISDFKLQFINLFDRVDREPKRRMFASSFIGVMDAERVNLLKETLGLSSTVWFELGKLPKDFTSDHEEIIKDAIAKWKVEVMKKDTLKVLFPKGVSLPELQDTYQNVSDEIYDRRNFRKKMVAEDILIDSGYYRLYKGKKPAKIYYIK